MKSRELHKRKDSRNEGLPIHNANISDDMKVRSQHLPTRFPRLAYTFTQLVRERAHLNLSFAIEHRRNIHLCAARLSDNNKFRAVNKMNNNFFVFRLIEMDAKHVIELRSIVAISSTARSRSCPLWCLT